MLVLGACASYSNSLSGPFVFDDLPAIRDNATIHDLGSALNPPAAEGNTVGGRPLLNVTFALNYLAHGLDVTGYHVANLALHLGTTLLLFGLVRRLALRSAIVTVKGSSAATATTFASVVALVWCVHPLQTESVSYIVQRAEVLGAFFILLTQYGFARGLDAAPQKAHRWFALAVAACFAGAASKETMVVAPVLVLFFDRAFGAGGWTLALRQRPWFYAGLAASWAVVAWFVFIAEGRGGSAGFQTAISPWTYFLTQTRAIVHYLALTFWPRGLVFDYGSPVVSSIGAAAPYIGALVLLFGAGVYALVKAPRVGVVAVAFFVLLAPSSSFVPVATQTMAEHRMYLPLAALVALVALALLRWLGARGLGILAALSIPLAVTTWQRNQDYRSAETLWQDTVTKRPDNPRAHNNLALIYAESERLTEAAHHLERAVALVPANPDALNNLGRTLARIGRYDEAVLRLQESLRYAPESRSAHLNLADVLVSAGRAPEAIEHYEHAARAEPLPAAALVNWGAALLQLNRATEAVRPLRTAIELEPSNARAQYNLGNAYASAKDWDGAIPHYQAAVRADPGYAPAWANLGNVLLLARRPAEAVEAYRRALQLRPNDSVLQRNLARAEAMLR